jgi:hypothetical protein
MRINAPLVNIEVDGNNLWFVRDNNNVLHQVRDIAHLGESTRRRQVVATVTEYPDGAINVPDENVRVKGD